MAHFILVAVGILLDSQGRVLIAQRHPQSHQGGLWEFPGGKLAPEETLEQGLYRELAEELGIQVVASEPLIGISHDYGDRQVRLEVYLVTQFIGTPHGLEGQPLRWVFPDTLNPLEFPAADRPIINTLRLPDQLLITGADPHQPLIFLARLTRALNNGIRLVQLRVPGLDPIAFQDLAVAVLECCQAHNAQLVINAPMADCPFLQGAGLHLNRHRLLHLQERPLGTDCWVGASCHNPGELIRAARLGLDYAVLSPVLPTISHPNTPALGWARFAEWVAPISLPVYALGGLVQADLTQAKNSGAQGIAAIRGLWNTVD